MLQRHNFLEFMRELGAIKTIYYSTVKEASYDHKNMLLLQEIL